MTPSGAKERVGGTVVSMVSDLRTLLPDAPITSVDQYLESGGGISLGKALSLPRAEITEVVAEAGLRGRGGAGFPAAASARPHRSYLIDGEDSFREPVTRGACA